MYLNKFVFSFLLALSLFCLPQSALAAWPFQMDSKENSSSPTIADINGDGVLEVVFVSSNGVVYCTDAAGDLLWNFNITDATAAFSSPTLVDVDGDPATLEVVIGFGDGVRIGGINVISNDGQLLAHYESPTQVVASPLVVDADLDGAKEIYYGRVMHGASVSDSDSTMSTWNFFYALDVVNDENGMSLTERWVSDVVYKGAVHGTAAAANLVGDDKLEIVFASVADSGQSDDEDYNGCTAPYYDNVVMCYDAYGNLLWETDSFTREIVASPAIVDRYSDGVYEVIVTENNGVMHALDGATGQKFNSGLVVPSLYYDVAPDVYFRTPAFAAELWGNGIDIVNVGGGQLYTVDAKFRYRIDAFDFEASQWSSPSVGDLDGDGPQEIVVGGVDSVGGSGIISAFNYDSKAMLQQLWSTSVAVNINSSPALADLDGDGTLEILFADYDHNLNVLDKDGNPFQFVTQYPLRDTAPWPSFHGNSANTREYVAPPPVPAATPGNLYVKSLDEDGQFPIRWWYSATPAVQYELEESADGGVTWASVPEYVDTATREVIRTNLTNGNYLYRVRAVRAGYTPSDWTYSSVCQVEIAVEPVRELSVPATKDDGRIFVSWKRSLTAGATYVAEQQVDGGAWEPVAEYTDPTATSFYLQNQLSGSYVFRIMAARNDTYYSDWVTSAPCVMTYDVVDEPLDVNAELKVHNGKVLVTWQGPVEPAAMAMAFAEPEPQVKYKVEKSSDGGVTWSLLYWTYKLQAWMPVEDNLTYQFRVSAHKPGSAASAYVVSGPIEVKLIAPPSNMYVKSADPDGQFPVFWWHSPTEGVTYELEESIDGGAYAPVAGFTDVTANKTIKTGATAGSYQFRIRAVKDGFTPSDWAYSTVCVVGG